MILIERFGGRGSVDVRLRSSRGSAVEAQGSFGEDRKAKSPMRL